MDPEDEDVMFAELAALAHTVVLIAVACGALVGGAVVGIVWRIARRC